VSQHTAQHLIAPNDVNGNPRRLYMVQVETNGVTIYDEGYLGSGAIPEQVRHRVEWLPEIHITAKEYKRLLKKYGKGN
jgi:hypothetical protein